MGTLTRRQLVLALGTIAGGTGMLVGSGAFTQVRAERDVELQTTGDSQALLAFAAAGTGTIVDDSGDVIGFDISGADGVNRNARTTFRPAMEVTNNGSNTVGLYVRSDTDIGSDGVLDVQGNATTDSIVGETNAIDVNAGSSNAVQIDLVIDLIDVSASKLEGIDTVTFVADQAAASS